MSYLVVIIAFLSLALTGCGEPMELKPESSAAEES
ncbi:hypothetical protein SAMN05421863_101712 [Nitrosomonas communis]|uniref:Lipoprotein n=1 Tax=Nitrosomonas communis TaxID=44574 RepID=A0A1I4NYB7_9PROT|nr:hypothetical protein SAMN05421863_101712 [Nitrosomonas communis]